MLLIFSHRLDPRWHKYKTDPTWGWSAHNSEDFYYKSILSRTVWYVKSQNQYVLLTICKKYTLISYFTNVDKFRISRPLIHDNQMENEMSCFCHVTVHCDTLTIFFNFGMIWKIYLHGIKLNYICYFHRKTVIISTTPLFKWVLFPLHVFFIYTKKAIFDM